MTRICHIEIDDRGLPPPTPEIEQERKVAIFDLLEDNSFALPARNGQDFPGPFRLALAIRDGRLVFELGSEAGEKVAEFHLSLGPFRQVVKDYFQICASYFDAVKRLPPPRSRRSTWRGVGSTTKVRAPCRSGSTARPASTSTRRGGCSR